jgi:hypothetical protein
MVFDLGFVAASSLSSAALTGSGFYLLTNWRLKKLEDQTTINTDTRERLIRIETSITNILNKMT